MTSEILWGYPWEGIDNSVPVWVFEKEDFNKRFTDILSIVLKTPASNDPKAFNRSISSIAFMWDEMLAAALMVFHGDKEMIKSQSDYVRELCNQIIVRKSIASSHLD